MDGAYKVRFPEPDEPIVPDAVEPVSEIPRQSSLFLSLFALNEFYRIAIVGNTDGTVKMKLLPNGGFAGIIR